MRIAFDADVTLDCRIALVFLALLLGGFVGFVTMGLNKVLCPASAANLPNQLISIGKDTISECKPVSATVFFFETYIKSTFSLSQALWD